MDLTGKAECKLVVQELILALGCECSDFVLTVYRGSQTEQ
jgi:hypothetical protein